MTTKKEKEEEYFLEGQGLGATNAIIGLVTGVGVATLVLIFVGALGGQVYNQVEADIDEISNATVRESVKASIISGFDALETTGSYMPIIVLAVIITLVLALVLSMTVVTTGVGGMRGSAL